MKGKCFIGTSGWSYDHWTGIFYPSDLKPYGRLAFYINNFNSVEINNTFYHLPSMSAFKGWKESAPKGFIYALKGSRFITHMKKLKDPEESLNLFLERASLLKNNLGPILFQLPPHWKRNLSRLEEFIKFLPDNRLFAFEFREPSWFNKGVYDLFRERGIALCIYHMPEFESPLEVTAKFVYIRFHGTEFLYGGRYSKDELSRWADKVKEFIKMGKDVYVYFNNDAYGYAVINAKELMEMVSVKAL
ncbi:MAG: DUF72 domain-containing protein [Nitrospinae bacterium]|nr:DUF72 domain-containing protein [Nitrospinota bacterium]